MNPNHPFPGTRGSKTHPKPSGGSSSFWNTPRTLADRTYQTQAHGVERSLQRTARTTLPRISVVRPRPRCTRTYSNGSYMSESFLYRNTASQALANTKSQSLDINIEGGGIQPRDVNINKPSHKKPWNTAVPRHVGVPAWLGPQSNIPKEILQLQSGNEASRPLPKIQASYGGARPKVPLTGQNRSNPNQPSVCVNYNTFISSALPTGSEVNVQRRRKILVQTKSVGTQSCANNAEEVEISTRVISPVQPVVNITSNDTIVLPAVTLEGDFDVDIGNFDEDPEVKADYKRRLSQALVDGGFREQTNSCNDSTVRPILPVHLDVNNDRDAQVNELVNSLNQLPHSLFTPVNSPQHSPEPVESGESGVDVGSMGNPSPLSPLSQCFSQWSVDASRGTPHNKAGRGRYPGATPGARSQRKVVREGRVSVADSISVKFTRREGERITNSRHSISHRNRQRAEDLRRTSLRNAKLPQTMQANKTKQSYRKESKSSIFEGELPKVDVHGRPKCEDYEEKRAEMMECYLNEQAEVAASRMKTRAKSGRILKDRKAGNTKNMKEQGLCTIAKSDSVLVRAEVGRGGQVRNKSAAIKHERSQDSPRSEDKKKRIRSQIEQRPGNIEIAVSPDEGRSQVPETPQRSPQGSPINLPRLVSDSERTTPSLCGQQSGTTYGNQISLSQPCSRRPSDYMHDMLSISEPCSRRASEYSPGNLGVDNSDAHRDSGFGNELTLLMDSKASTPALLDPQYLDQSRPQSSTSSSELHMEEDNVGSLPNSPFPAPGRGVLRRRSSSIDSSYSRPGSDLLEVPIYSALAKDRVPNVSDSPEVSPIASPCSMTSSDECYGDLQQQVVHRVVDQSQVPIVTTEPEQQPRPTFIEPPIIEQAADNQVVAPQVSLTTDDGDDFAVWFGRRGSIFIEEKGAEQNAPQPRTTTNEQGQVSLAVPTYQN